MRWINLTRADRKPTRGLFILLCCAWLTGSATSVYQQPSSTPPQATPQQPEPPAQKNDEAPKPAAPEFVGRIDAGHGGDDHGAIVGGKPQEKDVTLSLPRQLPCQRGRRVVAA